MDFSHVGSLELPFRKVQVVSVSEPLIRRWAGFGSVVIETAAARSGQGGTERRAALAPVVEHHTFRKWSRKPFEGWMLIRGPRRFIHPIERHCGAL